MPTDDGVGFEVPETRRTVQTVIQYRVAVGGNGERNDGKVMWWLSEGNLS
jgi:hypothetical protein